MTPAEAVQAVLRLQDLAHEAEFRASRPGRKRTAAQKRADYDASHEANMRVERFIHSLIGDRGMRPAREVNAEDDALLERLGL